MFCRVALWRVMARQATHGMACPIYPYPGEPTNLSLSLTTDQDIPIVNQNIPIACTLSWQKMLRPEKYVKNLENFPAGPRKPETRLKYLARRTGGHLYTKW